MSIEEQMKMIESYCNFEDPSAVYILLLLPRKKENLEQKEREKLQKRSRYVIQTLDDARFALEEFDRYSSMYPEITFRVYVSVNRRSLLKGMLNFQKRLLDFNKDAIQGNKEIWTPIAKLGSEFKSVLAKIESRYDKYYMFDIDLPNNASGAIETVRQFEEHLNDITDVVYSGRSKSGFAIVIKPCNPNDILMPPETELKKDAYLYVDCLNKALALGCTHGAMECSH